jgi:hypothetical protein
MEIITSMLINFTVLSIQLSKTQYKDMKMAILIQNSHLFGNSIST